VAACRLITAVDRLQDYARAKQVSECVSVCVFVSVARTRASVRVCMPYSWLSTGEVTRKSCCWWGCVADSIKTLQRCWKPLRRCLRNSKTTQMCPRWAAVVTVLCRQWGWWLMHGCDCTRLTADC